MLVETPMENGNPKFIANRKTIFGLVEDINSGGSDNILFVGDVTFENANGDTVTNHTFNITALTDTSYQFGSNRYKIRWNTWEVYIQNNCKVIKQS